MLAQNSTNQLKFIENGRKKAKRYRRLKAHK